MSKLLPSEKPLIKHQTLGNQPWVDVKVTSKESQQTQQFNICKLATKRIKETSKNNKIGLVTQN
uniref:Uncharacterized protein n=1 Tax=Rhizophora mucronata TaxID=61149 RepID=A0A2P2PE24_RHIMU